MPIMPTTKPTKQPTPKILRILWNSNAAWSHSGYGQQSAELLPHIRDAGYPIACSNFYGLSGGIINVDGIMQYPIINHTYGSDAMVLHGRHFNADIVMSLQDVWILNPQDLQQVTRWIPWLPIDFDPIPNAILEKLKFAYRIIAMSKFGQKQLQGKGLHATYIPHSVDTEVFKPMNKFQRKKDAGLPPDSYVVGMVSANKDNPPRKSYQQVLDAFKRFLEVEPKALLYLHTNPNFPGGFPISEYAKTLGIGDKVLFPDPYQLDFIFGKKEVALIMNTFDVLLNPSTSEGFGVSIIEAGACGVPVIVNRFTAMPEHVIEGVTGEICEVESKTFTGIGSYMAPPSTDSLYEKMVKIHKADRVAMGKAAREHIVKNYDTKMIFATKWIPFLERVQNEVYPPVDKPALKAL